MSTTKNHMSIGEVLKTLLEEFPDISISKIRFLETEGLIEPERTPSGYRKFTASDLARLRYILRLQRDHFMPLKVIRKRLEHFDPSAPDTDVPASTAVTDVAPSPKASTAPAPTPDDDDLGPSLDGGLSLSFDDLVSSSGLESDEIEELQEFGLIDPHPLDDGGVYYDEDDLMVARIARDFAKYGLGARHLRMYRNFADKEAGLFEQILVPLSRGNNEANRQLDQSAIELARLSNRLKRILLRASLKRHLGR